MSARESPDPCVDYMVRIVEPFPHIVMGVLGTLALALFLVLCSASALQAWHNVHHQQLRSMSGENHPTVVETGDPASSYWSGRR